MSSQAVKKNVSGIQVIKTLQFLLEDNYTMAELIERLNKNEKEPMFNNSVVSKYINTCRYCGFEILKIHNKYYVSKTPFSLEFSLRDIELIEHFKALSIQYLSYKINNSLDSFINKLNRYSNKDIVKVEKKNFEETYNLFQRAIKEKRKIRLLLRTKYVIECTPLEIVEYKNKTCFKIIHKNKERNISIERVSGLELLGKRFSFEDYSGETVIFKLTGALAQRYDLRENEKVLEKKLPECIKISNIGENKEELLTRLLRYGKNCEILSPSSYRNEIKNILHNMLANYGEE